MPNIHFFGFTTEKEYREIKSRIDPVLQKIEIKKEKEAVTNLGKEAVTTFHPGTIVESCDGKENSMPYLYIFSSEEEHIKMIIDAFCENGLFYDIEGSDKSFISAEEMEKKHKNL